jgi:V8-like Glu-specific endopeptidase
VTRAGKGREAKGGVRRERGSLSKNAHCSDGKLRPRRDATRERNETTCHVTPGEGASTKFRRKLRPPTVTEMRSRDLRSILAAALALACVDAPRVAEDRDTLVYGEDGRRDVYATESAQLRALALESAVAMLPETALVRQPDGSLEVAGEALGEFASLCPGEPFREQPTAALCSGVLIDDALVLTAGHCARAVAACEDQRWVFGYAVGTPDALPVSLHDDDIYTCRTVAVSTNKTTTDGRHWDYAVVELDRAVRPPRRPATLSVATVTQGDAMTVIGFPNGLPVKVAGGATVLDERAGTRDYFTLDSDTFDVNSGSGVFDDGGRLAGVFTRGGFDYEYQAEQGCFVARRLESLRDATQAEQAGYWAPAVAQWCGSDRVNPLCSVAATSCSSGAEPGSCALPPATASVSANGGCQIAPPMSGETELAASLLLVTPCLLVGSRRRSRRARDRSSKKSDERGRGATVARQ